VYTKLKNVASIAREQRAAQADARMGDCVPALRHALVKWAGDDFVRGRREASRNKAARTAAKAKRAAQAAAHLWDYMM
jgi:hypothetical protein